MFVKPDIQRLACSKRLLLLLCQYGDVLSITITYRLPVQELRGLGQASKI